MNHYKKQEIKKAKERLAQQKTKVVKVEYYWIQNLNVMELS